MNHDKTEGIKTRTDTFLQSTPLIDIFEMARQSGYGCAVYRLPRAKGKHLIIDRSAGISLGEVTLEDIGKGFIFHPYNAENHEIKFLWEDIHIYEENDKKGCHLVTGGIPDEALDKVFDRSSAPHYDYLATKHPGKITAGSEEEKHDFIGLVQQTIDAINDNHVQKVVVSRSKKFVLAEKFDAAKFFDALSDRYPNAFVYLTFIPGTGMWLGATPEVLIEIDDNKLFKTVALAATQSYDREVSRPEDASWSTKDIEEQALVSRYIINCFKKIRLREFEELGPRTYVSGDLIHLKTDFTVDMEQVAFSQLGSVMLQLLHPTSAVCGMPKEPAQEFIQNHEKFDREYFSGFLGPVNIHEETHLFVNLRCMKVMAGEGQLFAGAGIIASSNPEKEWKETEIKMDILLKVYNEMY